MMERERAAARVKEREPAAAGKEQEPAAAGKEQVVGQERAATWVPVQAKAPTRAPPPMEK